MERGLTRGCANAQDRHRHPQWPAPVEACHTKEYHSENQIGANDDFGLSRVIRQPSRQRRRNSRGDSGNHDEEADLFDTDSFSGLKPRGEVRQESNQATGSQKGGDHAGHTVRLPKVTGQTGCGKSSSRSASVFGKTRQHDCKYGDAHGGQRDKYRTPTPEFYRKASGADSDDEGEEIGHRNNAHGPPSMGIGIVIPGKRQGAGR